MSKLTAKRVLTILLTVVCVFMMTACDTTALEKEVGNIFTIALSIATYVVEAAVFVFIVRWLLK